jgi:tetratricopeptide (TPR) repeat protein
MDKAEAHNAAGNDAFNAGDLQRASDLYFEAVKANGKVAKYRTNLCNALIKRGRPAEALEEAAAAVAVDGSWPKGHYFKALAFEQLCQLPEALAACEEGLRIHRYVLP